MSKTSPPADTEPLPEHFREVLDYLVAETNRNPSAYCWAAGKQQLYGIDYATSERYRISGTFLYTTLKAMENRGLVRRQTRHESAIHGPRARYTIAYLTDTGREAHRTGRIPKPARSAPMNDFIEHPTVQSYNTQIADAVNNLSNGHRARLTVKGFVITAYVQWVADVEDRSIYATWQRDHLTGEITGKDTLVLPIADHRRAAAMACAQLENTTQQLA